MTSRDKLFTRVCYGFVFVQAAASLFPFVYILVVSLSDGAAIASGNLFSSENVLTLGSYKGLFLYADLGRSFANSVVLSLVGTLFNMTLTIPCAYALSRTETWGRNVIYGILILAMFFRGEMIPTYVWMSELGLQDTYFAIWLTKLVSVYNILILTSFFENLPRDVLNAAQLDGAGPMMILWRIVLPMSKAVLISISIFYMASWWNDYYLTMIYIRDPEKYTLPVRIIQMITNVEDSSVYSAQDAVYAKLSAYGVRAAGIVLSAVPMLLLIPLMQRIDIASITKHKK